MKHSSLHEGSTCSKPLSVSLLAEVVASAIRKINEAEVFTESLRDELSKYSFQQPEEGSFEFTSIKSMYDGFLKNGDLEKFYQKYYATVPVKSTQFFTGLSRIAATLLSTKVADCLIACCKRSKNSYLRGKGLACNTWEVMCCTICTSNMQEPVLWRASKLWQY